MGEWEKGGAVQTGKWVILAMVAAALAAAGMSFYYHRQASRRALEFYQPETALLIARAERVELLELAPPAGDTEGLETLVVGDERLTVLRVRDLSQAAGLVHARHALLEDANYAWQAPHDDCSPTWTHALRFSTGEQTATLLLDFDCERLLPLGRDQSVSIAPLAPGLKDFLAAQEAE